MSNTWTSPSAVAGELSGPLGTRGDPAGTAVPQPPLPGGCKPLHGLFVPLVPQAAPAAPKIAAPPQNKQFPHREQGKVFPVVSLRIWDGVGGHSL